MALPRWLEPSAPLCRVRRASRRARPFLKALRTGGLIAVFLLSAFGSMLPAGGSGNDAVCSSNPALTASLPALNQQKAGLQASVSTQRTLKLLAPPAERMATPVRRSRSALARTEQEPGRQTISPFQSRGPPLA